MRVLHCFGRHLRRVLVAQVAGEQQIVEWSHPDQRAEPPCRDSHEARAEQCAGQRRIVLQLRRVHGYAEEQQTRQCPKRARRTVGGTGEASRVPHGRQGRRCGHREQITNRRFLVPHRSQTSSHASDVVARPRNRLDHRAHPELAPGNGWTA
ncbi:hypothetical protein ALI144C_07090 [Actinosynnema sp. ALI-1.44]|nr:hypothetical protein ALI144C_07090 [Actinosynnema sp. ALI-1.44]